MSILDLLTIVLFSLGVLLTAIAFSRTGTDMKNFFAGGGNVPWPISGLSLFMGFFSAGTFVVWGSIAYSYGWVAVMIQLSMAIAGFAVGTWIAPRWHKTHCLTAAEYINDRLGVNVQRVYTYIFLIVSVFTTGSFLYPVAKIVEVATGIPLTVSILGLGLLCMIYVSIGGLRGVVVTDVLQFVILFAAVIIVVPLSFDKIGGIEQMLTDAPEGFFSCFQGEYSMWFVISFCVYNTIFLGGNWAYVQRYTSVQTSNDSRMVGWLFGCLYVVSAVLWMLPPMIYRIYNPSLEGLDNENAYLLMCKEAMPGGLLGLMLGGMIFATASSLNATLNISAGVFTNDIFHRLKPDASNTTLIRVARLSTLGFGVLALVVALLVKSMGGIVSVVISVAALTGVPLYLPLIWSLFSKRQCAGSVLGVTFISLAVNLLFKFVTPLFGLSLSRAWEMSVGAFVPVVLLALSECYLRSRRYVDPRYNSYVAKQDSVASDKETLSAETVLQSRSANHFTRQVLGIGVLLSGFMIFVLGSMPSVQSVIPMVIGMLIMCIGGFIIWKNKKEKI